MTLTIFSGFTYVNQSIALETIGITHSVLISGLCIIFFLLLSPLLEAGIPHVKDIVRALMIFFGVMVPAEENIALINLRSNPFVPIIILDKIYLRLVFPVERKLTDIVCSSNRTYSR